MWKLSGNLLSVIQRSSVPSFGRRTSKHAKYFITSPIPGQYLTFTKVRPMRRACCGGILPSVCSTVRTTSSTSPDVAVSHPGTSASTLALHEPRTSDLLRIQQQRTPSSPPHDVVFKGTIHRPSILSMLRRNPICQGPIRSIRERSQAISDNFGSVRNKRLYLFSSSAVQAASRDTTPRISWSLIVPQLASLRRDLLGPTACAAIDRFTSLAPHTESKRGEDVLLMSSLSSRERQSLLSARSVFVSDLNCKVSLMEEGLSLLDTPRDVHLVGLLSCFRGLALRPSAVSGAELMVSEAVGGLPCGSRSNLRVALLLKETLLAIEQSVSNTLEQSEVREGMLMSSTSADWSTSTDRLSRREMALFESNINELSGVLKWFGSDWTEAMMGFRVCGVDCAQHKDEEFPCLRRIVRLAAK